ncbi:MAG: DNA-binding protein [Chitinophagaceae bacterium]|nr:DNA-binding protein [Chitinophagaceae bacterium]
MIATSIKRLISSLVFTIFLLVMSLFVTAQKRVVGDDFQRAILNPPAAAKPWVFWYWMHGAVSKAGITADLEAMKEVGIGGAYLMPIKDTNNNIPFQPTVRQLTPAWWAMVKFAMTEAKRLHLTLGMHVSDGFALAGGPWITPAMSMQKLVWSKTYIRGGQISSITLPKPPANEDYYKDVAVFAYPVNNIQAFNKNSAIPTVYASNGTQPQFLCVKDSTNKSSFKSDTACWITYQYPQPFTCRAIQVHVGGNNYQAQRLEVQASNDGVHYTTVCKLIPPRHGWQDTDEDYTNSIPSVTATYFRFVYDKKGTEPGAEDLDAAKWKPSLKVMGIYLSDEPVINQFEAKNGSVWRVSSNTTTEQIPQETAIPLNKIINISNKMDAAGVIHWKAPPGNWVIVRIGHTSTGHTNYTGGAALGLECDKFNPAAVKLQFNNWFAKAFSQTDSALAKSVLKVLHVDSWECGSQNWSTSFPKAFLKQHGYDLIPYLLTMAGVPIQSAATSEKVLHDVRQTITTLVNDVFYTTLKQQAYAKGCQLSAEAIAPTMLSDGLLHYKIADLPMGEFWLNSPTHDKPNDMLDAISGAHIYGKRIIQAESFTSLRMDWSEHPGKLKIVGDRNFALGINKMVLHVFNHNPWMDKKPGMTLDGVGLYFQRDQTWFKQGKAWIDYLSRCQALLQMGSPVVDVAIFTGEALPRRSILPYRLVNSLPGIFGEDKLTAEKRRLENNIQPLRQIPDGVSHSANMADPEQWLNPLNGYTYDSFNPDVLLMMKVKNKRVVLPGGASYGVLVFPNQHTMQPDNQLVSTSVLKKILALLKDGATIILGNRYVDGVGLNDNTLEINRLNNQLLQYVNNGQLLLAQYNKPDFTSIGLEKDVDILENSSNIAWAHRQLGENDIYFISNQLNSTQKISINFRVNQRLLEIIDPVNGKILPSNSFLVKQIDPKTKVEGYLQPAQSLFFIFKKEKSVAIVKKALNTEINEIKFQNQAWKLQFDEKFGGPLMPMIVTTLTSWTKFTDSLAKYYSGTAKYSNTFNWVGMVNKSVTLAIDSIYNMASVKVNGINCGTIWTPPFTIDITQALHTGTNNIEIDVVNTWHNRLIGDNRLTIDKRITYTTAPFRLKDKPLLPAGIVGAVTLKVANAIE